MAKVHEQWCVLPHGPIEELAENLWRVEGTLEGMDLKRVLTVVRRVNGELVIHNAIALDDEAMVRIEAWGQPTTVIVPNGYHRLDAPAFQKRYPEAMLLCPKGATKNVSKVVRVDGAYEDFPEDPAVSFETLAGVGEAEGVMTVRSEDGVTLVFNDALFNMPHGRGITGFIFDASLGRPVAPGCRACSAGWRSRIARPYEPTLNVSPRRQVCRGSWCRIMRRSQTIRPVCCARSRAGSEDRSAGERLGL